MRRGHIHDLRHRIETVVAEVGDVAAGVIPEIPVCTQEAVRGTLGEGPGYISQSRPSGGSSFGCRPIPFGVWFPKFQTRTNFTSPVSPRWIISAIFTK